MFAIFSWFQVLKKTIHEVTVVLINPGIVISADTFENCVVSTFLESEEIGKLSQEILEQEARNKFVLNLGWKLIQQIFLMLIINCHISIIIPLVIKECLNSLS